jgi:GGDEF domain-containing protein
VTVYEDVKSYVEQLLALQRARNARVVTIYYRDVAKAIGDRYSHSAVSIALRRVCKELGGEYIRGTCIIVP